MDLVARSWLGMGPPFFRERLYTSDLGKASQPPAQFLPARRASSARAQLRRHVRGEQLDERRVHLGSTRDDVPLLTVFRAAEGAGTAPGLLDEERAGRRVPGAEADFPESIDPPGCDISQIERRGPGTADAGYLLGDRAQHVEI